MIFSFETSVHQHCVTGNGFLNLPETGERSEQVSQTGRRPVPVHCEDDWGTGPGVSEGDTGRRLSVRTCDSSAPGKVPIPTQDTVHRSSGQVSVERIAMS